MLQSMAIARYIAREYGRYRQTRAQNRSIKSVCGYHERQDTARILIYSNRLVGSAMDSEDSWFNYQFKCHFILHSHHFETLNKF